MTRGIGEVDTLQAVVPETLAFPIALLTQLGAIWFASVVLACVYRFYDRETAVVIAGLLVAGTGLWRTIKLAYPIPRPDQPLVAMEELPLLLQPLFDLAVVDTGPGFPSGHAVTTTVVYLSLAKYLSVNTRWNRYLGAIFVISLVGTTRMTLGVHYLVDVVGGAAIGHGLLVGFHWLVSTTSLPRATTALGLGVCSASVCLVTSALTSLFSFWELGLFAAGVALALWWHVLGRYRHPLRVGEPL